MLDLTAEPCHVAAGATAVTGAYRFYVVTVMLGSHKVISGTFSESNQAFY